MANWDNTFNTSPADDADISEGAARIRETRLESENRLGVDHNMGPAATEEAGGVPGRHMQGSAVAFTRSGATGPTQLNAVSQTMPVTNNGSSGTALGTKDQGRLWVNEGGQLYHWPGSAPWTLVNNIDPATMFDSDEATADRALAEGSWTTVEKDALPTDLECNITIPAQGLWRIEVRYSVSSVCSGGGLGGDSDVTLRAVLVDDDGPTTSYLGLGRAGMSQSAASNMSNYGNIAGVRSFNSVVLGAAYSIKLEAYVTIAGAGGGVNPSATTIASEQGSTTSWLEAVVLPYGA